MKKEEKVKDYEKNNGVYAEAIPKEVKTVSAKSGGATFGDSARIDISGRVAKVTVSNDGPYTLKVELMYSSFVAKSLKEWTLAKGETLNTGEFSVPVNTYWLRVGPMDGHIPAYGTGTLYSITYL